MFPPLIHGSLIEKRLAAMCAHFPQAMTRGFEHLIASAPAHPGDQHVLAANVHAQFDVLLTENTRHFWPTDPPPLCVNTSTLGRALLPDQVEEQLRTSMARTAKRVGPSCSTGSSLRGQGGAELSP